jgi:hypothetical protein
LIQCKAKQRGPDQASEPRDPNGLGGLGGWPGRSREFNLFCLNCNGLI